MSDVHKLSLRLPRSAAPAWAAAIEAWVMPEPLAMTSFADPPSGHWLLEAYFDAWTDPDDVRARLAETEAELESEALLQWQIAPVIDEDWTAKVQRELVPVRAGRFVVHGSHDRTRVRPARWALEIEAGQAFGTAHHDTTRGCLEAIDRLARRNVFARIVDVGCGTGVLAIAAAKAWPAARIVAGDTDPISVQIALDNARLNHAGGHLRAVTSAGLAQPMLRSGGPYDLILANILAQPLVALAPVFARARSRRGVLVLSGLLVEQTREVLGAYRAHGFFCRTRLQRGEWMTLILS